MRDPCVLAAYDSRILDPVLRGAYGACGYFNVGYWSGAPASFAEASDALVDLVIDAHPAALDGEILDVGCGLGDGTARIRGRMRSGQVRGINISETQLAICRDRWPGIPFQHGDAAAGLPGPVDHIVSVEAAFHFDTRRDFLAEAAASLRPGGTLRLADALFPADWAGTWTVPAANLLDGPDAYAAMVQETGFTDVRVRDITAQSWRPWARALARVLPDCPDAPGRSVWIEILPALEHMPMRYLVVAATRKTGG
jgi:MPBQ/MSBQ methyltransferase